MSVNRGNDPSKLHLKRELTQIRKAARVLRDPGTSSSWISPLSSGRSNAAASIAAFNGTALNENPPLPVGANLQDGRKEKKKRVFLYNWRNNSNDFDGSSAPGSVASASVDNSLSDIRNAAGREGAAVNGGSKDEATESRCRDARLTRAMGKPKSCKAPLSPFVQKQRRKRLQQVGYDSNSVNLEVVLKNAAPSSSIGLSQDDSASLIDQYGDTEEYYNSEDLDSLTAESPLLSRLRQKSLMKSISKFYRDNGRGDSSCTYSTPALSMSSFKRYMHAKIPSIAGSWDGASISYNDLEDEEDRLDFSGQQGCGIPCYWSRRSTPKLKLGYGSCSSPSLSDTTKLRGNRLLSGSQRDIQTRVRKQKIGSEAVQCRLPLLSDDEQSTNYGELDLESVSRLDGRRCPSSCRSQEEEEVVLDNVKSFSQRYRPLFFHALVGQTILVQSFMNALTKGKISPLYLFQGPRGTGKTSTAKIFAAALNCLATEGTKPCGNCTECTDFISCNNKDFVEVDGTDKKEMERVRCLLKGLAVEPTTASSRYKVFVIEECHLLSSKTWVGLVKFLEESLSRVVFIFITTDVENVPRTVLSRCQRYLFNKIKDGDIVRKLQRISSEERLDVDTDALELIAMNADGSLRDAETMLEQLSLLGKRITTSLVNELVGVVSDEKLLELLELAISSNTSETVKRARELLDSGADPLVLMSQLATLIMDIIAGNLTEVELQKLKHALKLLSEAEKQLRVSNERSTWFTATLLQLGSTSPEFTLSTSSRRQSSKTTDEDQSTASRDGLARHAQKSDASFLLIDSFNSNPNANLDQFIHSIDIASCHDDSMDGNMVFRQSDMQKLTEIWIQCVAKCHHEKLRQLLQTYGKLISLSEADAYIAFGDKKTKARAERYLISITSSFETVLRQNVEVKIVLLPSGLFPSVSGPHLSGCNQTEPIIRECQAASLTNSPLLDKRSPMQRVESIIREQRLETAWLQAVEKATPRSMTRLKHERNQVIAREGANCVQSKADLISMDSSSHHWEDELNHEIEVLKVNDKKALESGMKADHRPITPSLLHQSLNKEYQGYESGTGKGALLDREKEAGFCVLGSVSSLEMEADDTYICDFFFTYSFGMESSALMLVGDYWNKLAAYAFGMMNN
ncbi:hypothetical protein V2J09_019008 [Rumex salicifolius]